MPDSTPHSVTQPLSHSTQPPRFAIIVAGGTGTRMGADRPKQFLELLGEPVLLHTLRRFADPTVGVQRCILVLPADQFATWQQLCEQFAISISHVVVAGGTSRWASVRQGLAALADYPEGIVAVHDGVRPLVSAAVINNTYAAAVEHKAAIAAVPVKDSVRGLAQQGSYALDRSRLRLVQTPQCFELNLLRRAYQLPELPTFTDDASVVEDLHPIRLVEGDYRNLKITTPEDLIVAEALLRASTSSS